MQDSLGTHSPNFEEAFIRLRETATENFKKKEEEPQIFTRSGEIP